MKHDEYHNSKGERIKAESFGPGSKFTVVPATHSQKSAKSKAPQEINKSLLAFNNGKGLKEMGKAKSGGSKMNAFGRYVPTKNAMRGTSNGYMKTPSSGSPTIDDENIA